MKRSEWFIAFVIVLVAALSVTFFGVGEPEDQQVYDDEGMVTIVGQWPSQTDITIERIGEYRYALSPTYPYSYEPLTVSFEVDDPSSRDVFRLNEKSGMWELVPSTVADSALMIETDRLGTFALVDRPDIVAPSFASQFDALLDMAPGTTVGYELVVGVLDDAGDVWRLSDETQRGGCGGIVGRGNEYERSELEHEVRVFVDDVETLVHFLFVGLWTVDESGCEEGVELQSVL